jgi:hypothetical protein
MSTEINQTTKPKQTMSFWKNLFGSSSKQDQVRKTEPKIAPATTQPLAPSRPQPVPSSSPSINRDNVLEELEKYWKGRGDEGSAIERKLVNLGPQCLKLLKEIARDTSVKAVLRQYAIAVAFKFEDANKADFLAEFVNGKNPAALYAAYENGNSKAGEEFGLFRTAKDYLEQMGYTFNIK